MARIYMTPGEGVFTINRKSLEAYFPAELLRIVVAQPFVVVGEKGKYNVKVNVKGGGTTGQAEAIRMAVSRALVQINPEFKPALREKGYITRDSRMVERKKYGRRKARRRFQFSKR